MADRLFINKETFDKYKDVSEHLDIERIDSSVLEAQIGDLIAFIAEPLYLALQKDFTAPNTWATPKYESLFNGAEYKPAGQLYDVIYHGLEPVLVYFSYARLLNNLQLNITRMGAINYIESDVSENSTQAQIKTKVIDARALAMRYQEEVVNFIATNRADYPEYFASPSKQSTVPFTLIKL